MRFCILGSGSRGNATLIESNGIIVLIDAGFSGIEIQKRLAKTGRRLEDMAAIIVTHEHNDHINGAGVLSRRLQLPVFANPATHLAAEKKMGRPHKRSEFSTGEDFRVGPFVIHPFSVSHDTADPVGFTITDETSGLKLGYCTDTGKVTRLMAHRLHECNALVMESNHDPDMLKNGPYPPVLQQRVKSSRGHLANHESADFLASLVHKQLRHITLAHLSETNNLPELALLSTKEILAGTGIEVEIAIASQDKPGPEVNLRGCSKT